MLTCLRMRVYLGYPVRVTIWKFPLQLIDTQQVMMPSATQILTAQAQCEVLTIWGIVPDSEMNRADVVPITIEIHGTGRTDRSPHGLSYIGTVQSHAGLFVWHIFRR